MPTAPGVPRPQVAAVLAALLLFEVLAGADGAAAASRAGDLDSGHGAAGRATGVTPGLVLHDATVMEDGRTVAVGFESPAAVPVVLRFLPDGTPDPSFDGDGRAEPNLPGAQSVLRGVAVRPNGSILVAGTTNAGSVDGIVWQLLPGGAPDPAFGGGDGHVERDGAGAQSIDGLAPPLPDGRFSAVGKTAAGTGDAVVWRFAADGSPDTSFSGDGRALLDTGGNDDVGRDLANGPGGSVVVVVTSQPSVGLGTSVVHRLTPEGTPDASLDGDGEATVTVGDGNAVVVRDDGRILVGGTDAEGPHGSTGVVTGMLANGTTDPAFNGGLPHYLPATGGSTVSELLLQPDGRAVVGGRARAGAQSAPVLVRLLAEGTRDQDFGPADGLIGTFASGLGEVTALATRPDRKVVIGGLEDGAAFLERRHGVAVPDPPPAPAPVPPGPTPVGTPTPGVTPPTPKPKRPSAAAVIKLPSGCVRGGRLKLRLVRPAGVTLRSARVSVNGKRKRSLTRRLTTPFTIARLPRTARVAVTVTLADGTRLTRKKTYRRCAAARRSR